MSTKREVVLRTSGQLLSKLILNYASAVIYRPAAFCFWDTFNENGFHKVAPKGLFYYSLCRLCYDYQGFN